MDETKSKKGKFSKVIKILIVLILIPVFGIGLLIGAKKILPNYKNNEITDRVNLIINFSNVTGRMKQKLLIDNQNVIYLSFNDVMNYYDCNIYYDKEYNQIVTSTEDKLAVLKVGENKIEINGKKSDIKGGAKLENNIYYLPISEMEDVYNIKVKKVDNKVIIESLDKKSTKGTASKKIAVKYKATKWSRTLEKLSAGDIVRIAETEENSIPQGWIKVRTDNGNLGYVQKSDIKDIKVEREEKSQTKYINEKISLAWDYFSEYAKAPDNTGKKYDGVNVVSPSFFYLSLKDMQKNGATQIDIKQQARVKENVGDEGIKYIKWAKANGYQVWPKFSNETLTSTIDEFSTIINDYELRKIMIDDIISYVKKYDLDGINLDFEFMYEADKDAFSKFVIELAPRLRNIGVCLSVDVTAPDGASNWSLCYDRKVIGEVADYIVFMGYDQYGANTIGTTSGYKWVENTINKLIKNSEIPSDKIILGLPFYTKLWKTKDNQTINSSVVCLKNINSEILSGVKKEWIEELQQYYIQYEKGGYLYKMWIEDEKSFENKLGLVKEYNLAGAAYWRKGFESESVWKIVKNVLDL